MNPTKSFFPPAPLRLRLGVRDDRLSVKIIKRRGSGATPTLWLDAQKPAAPGMPARTQPAAAHAFA